MGNFGELLSNCKTPLGHTDSCTRARHKASRRQRASERRRPSASARSADGTTSRWATAGRRPRTGRMSLTQRLHPLPLGLQLTYPTGDTRLRTSEQTPAHRHQPPSVGSGGRVHLISSSSGGSESHSAGFAAIDEAAALHRLRRRLVRLELGLLAGVRVAHHGHGALRLEERHASFA